MVSIEPSEYIAQFDSGNIPSVSTAWTVTAPNAGVWDPSITTAGIISLTDGATAGDSAVVLGLDGTQWDLSISNGGVLSLDSSGSIDSSDTIAAITDSGDITWTLYVDDSNQVQVTTASVLPSLLRYPALEFTYTPASNTDVMLLHSARLNVTIKRRTA